MVKTLRDKRTGRFVGSVGGGKTRVPTSGSIPFIAPGSGSKNLGIAEAQRVLVALIEPEALNPDGLMRQAVALDVNLDPVVAEFLSHDSEILVLDSLLLNENLDTNIVNRLSYHPDYTVRRSAIYANKLSEERLAKLVGDEKREVSTLAVSAVASADILRNFASHEDSAYRVAVSVNRNTPPDLLLKLSVDDSLVVRNALVNNLSAPVEVFEKFCNDSDENIRLIALDSGKVSVNKLEEMVKYDPSEDVRYSAQIFLDRIKAGGK